MMFIYGLLWFFVLIPFIYASDTLNVSEEENISYGIETDFTAQYIWRGLSYNKGFIVQPIPWISFSNVTLSIWGNFPGIEKNSAEGSEIDFTAAYLYEFEDLLFEPSINYYTYPGQEEAPPTAEGNLKAAYNIFESELYINFTLDFLEYPGSITSDFGIAHQFDVSDKLNFSIDLNTGWGNRKFNQAYINPESAEGSLNYISISFSSNYYLNEMIYIKPHFENFSIISEILKEVSGNSLWNFGIAIGAEV